jgi:acyl-CoA thioester hydrolase
MTLDAEAVREPESLAQIRFQDCDPFGHLNNARYIDYFMNARSDHLAAHYGLQLYAQGQAAQASWVVKQTQVAYLRPARPAEYVRIRTRLVHYDETGLVVEGLMLDQDGRQLKSVAWIEFTYVSLATGRPTRHSQDWLSFLASINMTGAYAADGFNRRVADVRGQFRRVPAGAAP